MTLPAHHGWTHRPRFLGGSDQIAIGHYEIKVFADTNALDGNLPDEARIVDVGDGKFIFVIPRDLHGYELLHAHAYVTVAGAVTVQIRNITQAYDFLTTKITVDSGEYSSYTAATQPVIDDDLVVLTGDRIAIDVDAADGTAEGLGVTLIFGA